MCRKAAWAELTVKVTFVAGSRREVRGEKNIRGAFPLSVSVVLEKRRFIQRESPHIIYVSKNYCAG